MIRIMTFALLIASMLYSSNTAMAVSPTIQYKFSGIATSVDAPISSEFHVGEIVSGTFGLTFSVADPNIAFYNVTNFSANIGGHYPITSTSGDFEILNDWGGGSDQVKFNVNLPANGLSGPTVAGHVPDYFSFLLDYSGQSNLTSTNLVPQFIFSSPMDRSNLRFDVNDGIEVKFTLTDFSVVPEPSTVLIAVMGIGSLLIMGRKLPSSNQSKLHV